MLSREQATVFTQVSTGGNIIPEFVFKGKGTRTHLNPPEGMNVQLAPKGSYRLENMLSMVEKLRYPTDTTCFPIRTLQYMY